MEDLLREAVEKALREKGYSVVGMGWSEAISLEVDIHQFWSWFTPGFWTINLQRESIVEIRSSVLINGPSERIKGHVLLHSQGATGRAWMNTINKGIEKLIGEIKLRLKTH